MGVASVGGNLLLLCGRRHRQFQFVLATEALYECAPPRDGND